MNKIEIVAFNKGYLVKENGTVFGIKGHELKLMSDELGYQRFHIRDYDNSIKTVRVHRLVAYQKYGDKIFENGIVVRHLDGNSSNNTYENIEIGTYSENSMDIPSEKRMKLSIHANTFHRVLNDEQILELQRLYNEGYRQKYLMEKFGLTSKGTYSNYIHKEIKTG